MPLIAIFAAMLIESPYEGLLALPPGAPADARAPALSMPDVIDIGEARCYSMPMARR